MMSSTTPNQTFHQPHTTTTSTTTPGSSLIDLFTYQFDQLEASIIDSQRYFNQKISDQLQKQQNVDELEKQNDLLRRDVEFYSELLTTTNNQLNESTAKIAVLQQMVQNKTQHISTLQHNLQQSQQVQTELKQSIINSQQAQTELKKSIINITSQYNKKEEHYQHQITQLSNSALQVHMLEQQIQTYKKLNIEANNLKADLAKAVADYKTECATLTKANVLLQDQCNNQRQQLQDYVKAHQHGEKEKYNNHNQQANTDVQTKIIEEQRKQISHLRILCQDLTKQLQQQNQSSSSKPAVSMPSIEQQSTQKSPIPTKLRSNKTTSHPPVVDEENKMHNKVTSKKKAVGSSSHISKDMSDGPFQLEEEKQGQAQKKKKSHNQTDSKNVIKLQSTFGGSSDDDDGHRMPTSTAHGNSSGQQQQDVENHDANSHHKNDKKRKTSSTTRKKSRNQSDVSDRDNHDNQLQIFNDNDDDNDYDGDKADVLAQYALDQDDLQDPFLNLHVGHINKKSKMNWDE